MIQINPALVPRWYLMSFGRGREKIQLYYNRMSDSPTPAKRTKGSVWKLKRKSSGVFQKRCGIVNNPLDTSRIVWRSSMSQKPQEQVKTQKARRLTWEHNKRPMNQWPQTSKCIIVSVPEWDDQFSFGSAWIGSFGLSNNESSFDFGLSMMSVMLKRMNDDDFMLVGQYLHFNKLITYCINGFCM